MPGVLPTMLGRGRERRPFTMQAREIRERRVVVLAISSYVIVST
jgi:hypothetical protein